MEKKHSVKIDGYFFKKPRVDSIANEEPQHAAITVTALPSASTPGNECPGLAPAISSVIDAPVYNVDIGTIAGKRVSELSITQRQSVLQSTWVPDSAFKFPPSDNSLMNS